MEDDGFFVLEFVDEGWEGGVEGLGGKVEGVVDVVFYVVVVVDVDDGYGGGGGGVEEESGKGWGVEVGDGGDGYGGYFGDGVGVRVVLWGGKGVL